MRQQTYRRGDPPRKQNKKGMEVRVEVIINQILIQHIDKSFNLYNREQAPVFTNESTSYYTDVNP